MKVMKFGGTSVGTSESILSVLEAISNESSKKIVVLSASAGVTDLLYEIVNSLPEEIDIAKRKLQHLSSKISLLTTNLKSSQSTINLLDEIIGSITEQIEGVKLLGLTTAKVNNKIIATGEYLSTNLVFEHLQNTDNSTYLDIRDYLFYNSKSGDYEIRGLEKLKNLFANYDTIITQGFICTDYEGNISNLGRGGSDYTASILAAELDAEELQIWTDVNGVMSADPRMIAKPITKHSINIANLNKMAFFGAKVIHPETLKPTLCKSIPVRILNTFDRKNSGTLITNSNDNPIPTLTIKKKCKHYTFHSGKKKNLYYLHSYMLRLILKNSLHLLTTSHKDTTIQYTFENVIDRLIDKNLDYEVDEVDLIYICELNNSKINIILKKINILKIERLEVDWKNRAILILASTDNSDIEYNEFHDLLINIVE